MILHNAADGETAEALLTAIGPEREVLRLKQSRNASRQQYLFDWIPHTGARCLLSDPPPIERANFGHLSDL